MLDFLFCYLVLLPLVAAIGAGVGSAFGADPLFAALFTVLIDMGLGVSAYFLVGSSRGQTLGKQLMRIRLCREDGERLGFWRTIGRNLLSYLSTLPLLIGWFAPFWTEKRQTWHDSMMKTVVIRDTSARLAKRAVIWGIALTVFSGVVFGAVTGLLAEDLCRAGFNLGVQTVDGSEHMAYDLEGGYGTELVC